MIRRRVLVNLVLAAGVGVLVLAAWLTGEEPAPAALPLLTQIAPERIQRIRIERLTDAIAFQRAGNQWQMTEPLAAPAKPARITAILQLLSTRVHARFPADTAALERFGLSTPSLKLELDDQQFFFGETNPLDRRRYIRYGESAYLVNDNLYPQLMQNADFFVDVPEPAAESAAP